LSLFEYSKWKASLAEMTDEHIKESIKYMKRKNLSFFTRGINELYYRINICASGEKPCRIHFYWCIRRF
jgi:archaellum biogenesis protein FlaJ (TadC family)